MDLADFCDDTHTQQFVAWLSARIDGAEALNFAHADGSFATLSAARDAYQWPLWRKTIPTPDGELTLAAKASLAENQAVLDQLSHGLRKCIADPVPDETILAGWVQAVLMWGGVYTRRRDGGGNAGWLDARRQASDLANTLRAATDAFRRGTIRLVNGPAELRSNAGLTKVYSLTLDNFVIYDSRVAGALAWLVTIWAREDGGPPDHLKFACMRANEGNPKGRTLGFAKVRSPDAVTFKYFAPATHLRDHWKHAVWNQRANHVLAAALNLARKRQAKAVVPGFQTVRDVEAALFVMGADLRHALV